MTNRETRVLRDRTFVATEMLKKCTKPMFLSRTILT